MVRRSIVIVLCAVMLAACTDSKDSVLGEPLGESTGVLSDQAAVISAECGSYFSSAAQAGLTIPTGWVVICPGGANGERGKAHWGITCFGGPCPEGQGPYISINLSKIGTSEIIRSYVVRHELCHANGNRGERAADQCAAEHGASLRYSPYQ